jgi:uncharacterized protein YyaL (SSP411 family)
MSGTMTRNRLDQETSLYLLQHKDNPVHWQPWGGDAIDRARRENRPILLSIGYAACHWCHVMAHESFEDDETAALMNEGFVSIKVDREERPDVDSIYQTALALIGQQGGWPLTMFLTPEGVPFWGGTYFPPTPRFNRPSFRDVLRRVVEVYHHEPASVAQNAEAIRRALERLSTPKGGGAVGLDVLKRAAQRVLDHVDPVHGGLAGAPKFPHPNVFEFLWRGWKLTGQTPFFEAVTRTLDRISLGGIYDHLGGGFARYSTDGEWLMLYDNAQLIDLLVLVWQETRSPLYAARIRETADWVLREMMLQGGGVASSVDADSEGREGRFYVWTAAEIDRLLGPEAVAFKDAYGVTEAGNWEDVNILSRVGPAFVDEALEERLAGCRAILREAREQRVKPARDDKVIADWNGLMIAALANAGMVFGTAPWIDAAARAFALVGDHMSRNGRLRHSWCRGHSAHPATLDDYAAMCRAALVLSEATGEGAYLDQAETWVAAADRHFWDEARGGYFFTADDTGDLITRTKTALDAATPSGNAVMAGVLARLYHLSGKDAYRARGEAVIGAFSGELGAQVIPYASLLNGTDFLHRAVEVVIVGDRDAADTAGLLQAVFGVSLPNRVLSVIAPGAGLRKGHPAGGKGQVEGRASAYVCQGGTCSAPLTDPAALAEDLERR